MTRRSRSRSSDRARPVVARRGHPPWLGIDARLDTPDPPWVSRAAWAAIAITTAALLWLALRVHVVGDYFTESDFYGGYADGARLVQHAHLDPSRNGVYGPLYEIVLGVLGFAIPDLFTAARVLSVLCAAATLALTFLLLAKRVRPAVGLWTVLFLGANAVFLRYGFSATTDALAVALQTAAIFALVAGRSRAAPWVAGLLAALATLTRYSAVAVVPAALACYVWLERPATLSRRRATALYLAGFAALVLPWLAFSLAHGHFPGERLISNFASFYRNPEASRNVQDLRIGAADSAAAIGVVARAAAPGLLHNLVDHLRRDLVTLLGWPAALTCALGFLIAWRDRLGGRLAHYWISGACLFAVLVPIFYSDRYSLPYLPVYLSLAGIALGSPRLALVVRGVLPLKWVIGLLPLALTVHSATLGLRQVLSQMPVEVIAAGRALRAHAPPGARVLSRKGHIGYYSGVAPVAFPHLTNVPDLARYCRANGVGYIFMSWYEAELRSEFWALLDTQRVLPGLEVLFATDRNPAVLYQVGRRFGEVPDWFANDTLRHLQEARAQVRVLNDADAWSAHLVLGFDAARHGDPEGALAHYRMVTRVRPQESAAWFGIGDATMRLDRPAEAERAFANVLALEPGHRAARFRLGSLQMMRGADRLAAETLRPLVPLVEDRRLLGQLLGLFERAGDAATAARIRAALEAPTAPEPRSPRR